MDLLLGLGAFVILTLVFTGTLAFMRGLGPHEAGGLPPASPHDTRGSEMKNCYHPYVEPVYTFGETEPVAWICTDPGCYRQLNEDASQVVAWRVHEKWRNLGPWTDPDAAQARADAIERAWRK
jgi:hypothetical protein